MSLESEVQQAMKDAMKAKDSVRLQALRSIRSAILNAKTEKDAQELTRETEIAMLQKLAKQRRESAEIYRRQGRNDLAQPEEEELEVIERFLPAQIDDEELERRLQAIVEETGATGMKDMGKVMGRASQALAGQAENQRISAIAKKLLGGG
jgi:uncharacterized protein YqeY